MRLSSSRRRGSSVPRSSAAGLIPRTSVPASWAAPSTLAAEGCPRSKMISLKPARKAASAAPGAAVQSNAAVKGAPGWAAAACSKTPLNQPGPAFSAAPGADSSSKGRPAAIRSAHSACARPCTTTAGSLRNAFTIDPKALACQAFRKRIALRSCGAKASGEA